MNGRMTEAEAFKLGMVRALVVHITIGWREGVHSTPDDVQKVTTLLKENETDHNGGGIPVVLAGLNPHGVLCVTRVFARLVKPSPGLLARVRKVRGVATVRDSFVARDLLVGDSEAMLHAMMRRAADGGDDGGLVH